MNNLKERVSKLGDFVLSNAYKVVPETVPPVVIYGVLGVGAFIILRGALK